MHTFEQTSKRRCAATAERPDPRLQTQERRQGDLIVTALVIAEHDNQSIKGAALNTVTAVPELVAAL
jgi:hypothetical protein